MTRREMLAATGCYELAELKLLDRLSQIGERRMDRRFAKLTMHLVACLRSAKGGPVRLDEFLLQTLDDAERSGPAPTAAAFDQAAGCGRQRGQQGQ